MASNKTGINNPTTKVDLELGKALLGIVAAEIDMRYLQYGDFLRMLPVVGTLALLPTIAIAVVILINTLAGQLPAGFAQIDLTGNSLYDISDTSRDYLAAMEEDVSILVHIISLRKLDTEIFFNKRGIVTVGDKADILAVCLVFHNKVMLCGDFPYLLFGVFSQRHQDVGKLLLSKVVQNVALVFG